MTAFTWLVLLLLLASLLLHGNRKGNKTFIIIAFVLLFTVMGLRDVYSCGSDSSGVNGSYPVSFNWAGNIEWNELNGNLTKNYNVGFMYIMKLIYLLSDGKYQVFISIISFFIIFAYVRFIARYSPSPIQSALYFLGLLYFIMMFDALKQALAMAILLFSFDAIMEKRPVRFVLLVLIASQIHFPALIFLPAYWIGRMRIGRSYLLLLAALLVVTYFFRDQILRLMLNAYGDEDINASMEGVRFLRNKAIVMIVIVIAAVMLRPPTVGDNIYNACLVFAGVSIVFQTFSGYNNIFERLADYYFHTSIILLPLIFEKREYKTHLLEVRTERLIKNFAPALFCVFAIWRFLSYVNNSPLYSEFRFIWQ